MGRTSAGGRGGTTGGPGAAAIGGEKEMQRLMRGRIARTPRLARAAGGTRTAADVRRAARAARG